jgi:hypothetical protein
MITRSVADSIILAMTPSTDTRRLLLVTDRRTSAASGVRRYRLARRHGDRHLPVALPVRKTV